ncbi:MAG: endonuclease III [Candidatus Altiarchaeota archaeon]|nr:endonuclease III [Candidatus Altiarchaeota archaeon]
METQKRALKIIKTLEKEYSDPRMELDYTNPLQLLVATILSAQCTDKRVNIVTKELFKKYRKAEDYAKADPGTFEQEIRSTGFYKNKAKNIISAAKKIVEVYGSQVPDNMEDLLTLPGVARKTANIVLANGYGIPAGIAVDTHVKRISARLGLTREKDPVKIERDLMKFLPKEQWIKVNRMLVLHGRYVCTAKKPLCAKCVLNKTCPSAFKIKNAS